MNDFGRLLEREIPRLRRYARALTRDVSRADDLVQDTLVRAIAQQHHWQCGTDLRAWLFTDSAQPECKRRPAQPARRHSRRVRR
jgi:DNA-directed RNA polymerase specialized sigma24 family protein